MKTGKGVYTRVYVPCRDSAGRAGSGGGGKVVTFLKVVTFVTRLLKL